MVNVLSEHRLICKLLDIQQVHGLVQKLQRVAKDAGHERPLMIGIDQENGETNMAISSRIRFHTWN